MKSEKKGNNEKYEQIRSIIDIGKTDTAYRDIYNEHAKRLISDILPYEGYIDLIEERERLSRLPNKINASIERGDWESVEELSKKMKRLHKRVEEEQELFGLGKEVYDNNDIYINPFLTGMSHIVGVKIDELSALCKKIIKELNGLSISDPKLKDFYIARKNYYNTIGFRFSEKKDYTELSVWNEEELNIRARQALESGDMDLLEEISKSIIMNRKRKAGKSLSAPQDDTILPDASSAERSFEFSSDTIYSARSLGLIQAHIEGLPEYSALYRHALHPEFGKEKGVSWDDMKSDDEVFKKGIPEALKKRVESFVRHTFINSGGTRHFPDFVSEDFLVENFPEKEVIIEKTESRLLSILGLKKRIGLSRIKIEKALFNNGYSIIKNELNMDPDLFRLVCIPPDLYLRLGGSLGWGKQELWTHFDGYEVLQNGSFNALAGGDSRFGGIYDLVNIKRDYESERVVARFAVVQRKRMLK